MVRPPGQNCEAKVSAIGLGTESLRASAALESNTGSPLSEVRVLAFNTSKIALWQVMLQPMPNTVSVG